MLMVNQVNQVNGVNGVNGVKELGGATVPSRAVRVRKGLQVNRTL